LGTANPITIKEIHNLSEDKIAPIQIAIGSFSDFRKWTELGFIECRKKKQKNKRSVQSHSPCKVETGERIGK
jgi:hypothetical protein